MKNNFIVALALLFLCSFVSCSNSSNSEGHTESQEASNTERSSGEDVTLVYQVQYKGEEGLTSAGSIKIYFSDGAVRSEMDMHIMGQSMKMTMLGNASTPNETLILNDEKKTYSKMNIPGMADNEMVKKMQDMQKDSLIVVGEEQINGYACTQVNIVTSTEIPSALGDIIGDDGKTTTQYWLTKDIPGYERYQRLLESSPELFSGSTADIYRYGIPVKQVTLESGEITMIMAIESLEQQDIPDSKFEIPDDYKEV